MPNEKLILAHKSLIKNGYEVPQNVNDFEAQLNSDPTMLEGLHKSFVKLGYEVPQSKDEFAYSLGLKKKESSVSNTDGVDQPSSSGTTQTTKSPYSASSSKSDGIYKLGGSEKATYKKENGEWFVDWNSKGKFMPLSKGDVASRVKNLENNARLDNDLTTAKMPNAELLTPGIKIEKAMSDATFGMGVADPVTQIADKERTLISEQKRAEVFTGFPGKEENKYRVIDGVWQRSTPLDGGKYSEWKTVTNAGAIDGLNKQFKKEIDFSTSEVAKELKDDKFKYADITSKLIDGEEENVAKYLNNRYASRGFTFEESGVGDFIVVKSKLPGVEPLKISLDNWTDGEDSENASLLRAYLKENEYDEEKARELEFSQKYSDISRPEYIDVNSQQEGTLQSPIIPSIAIDLRADMDKQLALKKLEDDSGIKMADLEKKLAAKKKVLPNTTEGIQRQAEVSKKMSREYANSELRELNSRTNHITSSINAFNKKVKEFEEQIPNLTQEEIDLRQKELSIEQKALADRVERLDVDSKNVNNIVNVQAEGIVSEKLAKEKQGTAIGSIGRAFVDSAIDATLGLGQVSKQDRDAIIDGISGSFTTTTDEFMNSKDRGQFTKVLQTIAQMAPAMVIPPAARPLFFFGQAYTNSKDEIDAVAPDMLESDKQLLSLTIGLGVGALEKYGFDAISSAKPVNNWLVKNFGRIISGLPKEATIAEIKSAISADFKKAIADKVLTITSKGVVEGATESSQTLYTAGVKELYDAITDKDVFKQDWSTLGKQMLDDFALGAMTGGLVSSVASLPSTVTELSNVKNFAAARDIANDPDLMSLMTNQLKAQIISKEITPQEAKDKLTAMRDFKALSDQVPDNLSAENAQVAVTLIQEKEQLKKEIAGKDPNLVLDKQERINTINEELKTISTNAIQEQTTDESVLRTEQPEMGLQEVEQGNSEQEVIAEESEPSFEEIKSLDVTDATNLQKVQSWLDKSINDLDAFGKETLGVNIPVAVAKTVLKTVKKLVDAGVSLEEAFKQAAKENNVAELDVIDALDRVKKVTPEKVTDKKVTINERVALKDQIKLEAKAAKEGAKAVEDSVKSILSNVATRLPEGEMKVRQVRYITNKLKQTNLLSDKSVSDFIKYVDKISTNVEYFNSVRKSKSNSIRLKRVSKNMPQPTAMVFKDFAKIDPTKVNDIDKHNEIGAILVEASKNSRFIKGDMKFREMIETKDVEAYIEEQLSKQLPTVEDARSRYERITGESSEGMTDEDIQDAFVQFATEKSDKMKKAVRLALDSMDVDDDAPSYVKEAIEMDIDYLKPSDAVKVVELIDNYNKNGYASGLKKIVAIYNGNKNADTSDIKMRELGSVFGRWASRSYNSWFANLNLFLEKKLRTKEAYVKFMRESGLTKFEEGMNKSSILVNDFKKKYSNKFDKVKGFNNPDNILERGMYAFLMRTNTKTDKFGDRKKLIEQTIETLRNGDSNQVAEAKIMQTVYDRMSVKDATKYEDLVVSKTNKDAVKFVQDMWSTVYDDLYDHSLAMYNTLLEKDINYTTDRYKTIEGKTLDVDTDSSAFGLFSGISTKKSGVLFKAETPSTLPKGKIVDFNFDNVNFSAFENALFDLNAQEAIYQVKAYIDSDNFKNIAGSFEDAKTLKDSIVSFINDRKGKSFVSDDDYKDLKSAINKLGTIGSSLSLSSVQAMVGQYVPMMLHTIVTANPQNINLGDPFNIKVLEFMSRSNKSIVIRTIDSIKTMEKVEDQIVNSNGFKSIAMKPIDLMASFSEKMLTLTNSKADVWSGISTWMAHYRYYCKKNNIPIDYDGNPNDEAADYAEMMAERQINVSDVSKRGKWMKNKSTLSVLIRQTVFPFASFAINQKNRIYADIYNINTDKVKSARSLAGTTLEIASYAAIKTAFAYYIAKLALAYVGVDDEEEEKKAMKNVLKGTLGQTSSDVFSPIPTTDPLVVSALNKLIEFSGIGNPNNELTRAYIDKINEERKRDGEEPLTKDEEQEKIKEFYEKELFQFYQDDRKDRLADSYGILGVGYDKWSQFGEITSLASSGKYEKDYNGRTTEMQLSEEGMRKLDIPLTLKLAGLISGVREFNTLADKEVKYIKKYDGQTINQSDKLLELKKAKINIDDNVKMMIKRGMGVDKIIEEVNWANDYFKSQKQKDAYFSIMKEHGEVTGEEIDDILSK